MKMSECHNVVGLDYTRRQAEEVIKLEKGARPLTLTKIFRMPSIETIILVLLVLGAKLCIASDKLQTAQKITVPS